MQPLSCPANVQGDERVSHLAQPFGKLVPNELGRRMSVEAREDRAIRDVEQESLLPAGQAVLFR